MTRINLVKPEDLADQHLFAEWREIKMIPARVKKLYSQYEEDIASGKLKMLGFVRHRMTDLPSKYTMSTGHVRFFYDKMLFLFDRYKILTEELKIRNYSIAEHDARALFFDGMTIHNRTREWSPSPPEVLINIQRISERLNERPDWYRYHGVVKPPSFFIERFNHSLLVDTLKG